jgi:hypothetical protein
MVETVPIPAPQMTVPLQILRRLHFVQGRWKIPYGPSSSRLPVQLPFKLLGRELLVADLFVHGSSDCFPDHVPD